MELFLAYGAGLLTLINPCVLPILPIVLASAVQAHRLGPVAVALGLSVSFVALGMLVSVAGRSLGISETTIANAGAVLMIMFGVTLLVPAFSSGFATATGGFAQSADARLDQLDRAGLSGQFMTGALLGAVWSPCIGPTLGGAIALASQGQNLIWVFAIMVAFAVGVSSIVLALGYGARAAIMKRQGVMRQIAHRSRPVMGLVLVVVGVGILFKIHHLIEAWAINALPAWLIDLSVSL